MGNTFSSTNTSQIDVIQIPTIDGINLSKSKIIDRDGNRIFITLPLSFNEIFDGSISRFKTILYDRNRPIDERRCREMSCLIGQRENFHWGTITIGVIQSNPNRPYLLDGQHRIYATSNITRQPPFNAHIQIIEFSNINEMHDAFIDLNQGVPLPVNYRTSRELITKIIPLKVIANLDQYWTEQLSRPIQVSKMIKTSNRPHAPCISEMTIKELVRCLLQHPEYGLCERFFIRTDPDQTASNIIKLLYEFNELYVDKVPAYHKFRFSSNSTVDDRLELIKFCKKYHFWLGYIIIDDIKKLLLSFAKEKFYQLFPVPVELLYLDDIVPDDEEGDQVAESEDDQVPNEDDPVPDSEDDQVVD